MGKIVPRTRNGGKWTESMLMGRIRSALRRISMYYEPIKQAKDKVRKSVRGRRHKYEYQCCECSGWFKSKEVEVNHKIPAGSLKSFKDLPKFCERLFCEDVNGYEVVCKPCHKQISKKQREERKK